MAPNRSGPALIVAPWGEILADAGSDPGFILADIDIEKVATARGAVPALRHDRPFAGPIVRTLAAAG